MEIETETQPAEIEVGGDGDSDIEEIEVDDDDISEVEIIEQDIKPEPEQDVKPEPETEMVMTSKGPMPKYKTTSCGLRLQLIDFKSQPPPFVPIELPVLKKGGDEDPDVVEVTADGEKVMPKLKRRIRTGGSHKYKFCPRCANLLQVKPVDKKTKSGWQWKCATCPYVLPVTHKRKFLIYLDHRKDEEEDSDIVERDKADEHRQRTEILCPMCNHNEAFFYQMQTRSADEPMTTFYECCDRKCRNNWRD